MNHARLQIPSAAAHTILKEANSGASATAVVPYMHAYMINYACMLQIPHSSCNIKAIMALYQTACVSFNT
jgi:hypothetical protein